MKTPFEKQLENAYKIFKNDHERLREEMISSVMAPQIEPEPEKEYIPKCRSSGPSLGEIIMDSKIFKIAAGIIILGIVAIALKIFTGTNTVTSIAFGEVLNQIHSKSYTFDMTTISDGQTLGKGKCMVFQPGMMRFDTPELMGGFTSIGNLNTNESIIILHGQKIVINMKEYLKTQGIPDQVGPFSMFSNPIENLWNLPDGTQTSLGKKEIDGQTAVGFKIEQKQDSYSCDIVVWANSQTGMPIQAEIISYDPENPSDSMTELMDKFNLDVDLDPELFSMETPEGYTLAYQETLEESVQNDESTTSESEKIIRSMESLNNREEDKAIETLLSVDWTQSFNFPSTMYFFSISEKRLIQLQLDAQEKVMQEMTNTQEQFRKLCSKVWEDAQEAISNKEYEKAEKYLTTTLEFGRMINNYPDISSIAKLTGYAMQIKSLNEMLKLYKESGKPDKLQNTQDIYDKITTERESLIQASIQN